MPTLDVSKVLKSAAFRNVIDVIRNVESVSEGGMMQIAPVTFPKISCVVTQRNGDIMRRETAGQRVEGTISIYTQFQLSAGKDLGGQSLTADIVVYPAGSGNRYTVYQVQDYSDYGRGYVSAMCSLIPLTPAG